MVRERVKNRVFHDQFLVPFPSAETPFPMSVFGNDEHPLEVDVGCGRGRFLLAKAQGHPATNFLGIDKSLLRLRKIDRKAQASSLTNIRLLNADAMEALATLPPLSVSVFYVFYPDPWPKRRHYERRLISPPFIDLIFTTLAAGGVIHLCTDHDDYFSAMTRCWESDTRFRATEPFIPSDEEETDFGLLFRLQNLRQNRCSFRKASLLGS